MPNYTNGKIYTIRCKTNNSLIYVGSTCQKLCKRLSDHKKDWKNGKKYNLYKYISDWNDWYIELYENYPSTCNEELNKKKGEVIRQIATVNKVIAGRTPQEYREDNKQYIQQRTRNYYRNNFQKIQYTNQNKSEVAQKKAKEAKKKYQQTHSIKLQEYHKEYYAKNAKQILEKNKSYRKEKKEQIKEQKTAKITCSCGKTLTKACMSRHIHSIFHLKNSKKDISNIIVEDDNKGNKTA